MDSNLTLLSLLAAILIFSIAALRKRLIYEIQSVSLLLSGNPHLGTYIYSLIFLPGTILHELSHLLTAEILQVPTGKLDIFPSSEHSNPGERRLGYVMTGQTGPLRGFFIGFAPLVTGITALIILGFLLDRLWVSAAPYWQIGLTVYGLIVVGNSMIVSSADRRNWPIIAILAVIITLVFSRLNLSIPSSLSNILSTTLPRVNQALGLTIGLNLAMIGGSYALRRILERVTNKRIIRGRQ